MAKKRLKIKDKQGNVVDFDISSASVTIDAEGKSLDVKLSELVAAIASAVKSVTFNGQTKPIDINGNVDIGQQMNPNWNESNPNYPSFIENKPDVVNDLQLEQSTKVLKKTRNGVVQEVLTVPSRTSQLQNDSGYITADQVPSGVQVDEQMSSTSTQPVQNKVIKAYVDNLIQGLIDGAPEELNTLKELSVALGNNADFVSVVMQQISAKYTKPQGGIPASDFAPGVIPDTSTLQPKLIAGDGIAIAQDGKTVSVDTGAVAANETKPVSGKDVKEAIDAATPSIDQSTKNWVIGGEVTSYPSRGEKGDNAPVPYVGQNGNWWVGGVDTEVPAQGEKGDTVVVTDGQTFEFANNLNDDSTTKGLTAAMGKRLGDAVFDGAEIDFKAAIDAVSLLGVYLNPTTGKWAESSDYQGKIIAVPIAYRGWKVRMKCLKLSGSGNYFLRYAWLTTNAHTKNVDADLCANTSVVNNSGETATEYVEDTIPADCNFMYVYAFSNANIESEKDVTPREAVAIDPNQTNRIERLEDKTDGVEEIKEDWFAVSGAAQQFSIPKSDIIVKMSINVNTGALAVNSPSVLCAPKTTGFSTGTAYKPTKSECYKVSDLPNKALNIKFNDHPGYSWATTVVLYDAELNFITRLDYIHVTSADDWEHTFDLSSYATAKYFKLLFVHRDAEGGNGDDAELVFAALDEGWCEFTMQPVARDSMPSRVAALEAAVAGSAKDTIRILQYNVGHFNMGMQATPAAIGTGAGIAATYPQFFDYDTQLARWKSKIQNICADVMCLEEYSTAFGKKNNETVLTESCGIFAGYPYIAYGTTESTAYWVNALVSRFPLIDVTKVDLGSTVSAKAFMEVATIDVNGVEVKVAATHLNWSSSQNNHDSRILEMKNIIKYFSTSDHVIVCGDFNADGPYNAEGEYEDYDFKAGAAEFDLFLYGFTENGNVYAGGYTAANHGVMGDLPTFCASGSRPDRDDRPQVPYCYLDNVLVKGFRMSNVIVIDDGNLTDHCGIMCDLTLID